MWLIEIHTRLPGEVLICITLPVEVTHISLQGRMHVVNFAFPPGEDACEIKDIYEISRGGLDIYHTSSGGVPHSLQGRMHVDIIQYIQRLPGEVDHRFTFPPGEDACGYN